MPSTLLVLPLNDPEAVQIHEVAKQLPELELWISSQPHGAVLEKEEGLLVRAKELGVKRVVIVEIPGEAIEAELREAGIEVAIIDHHQYDGLDRAHDAEGKIRKSSLEQFLELFLITDEQLAGYGFDAFLVRSIGVLDRGYVWALEREGRTWEQIEQIMRYSDELGEKIHDADSEKEKRIAAEHIWNAREEWNGFFVMRHAHAYGVRAFVSRLSALEYRMPRAIILLEDGRNCVYVQESVKAPALYKRFGGFTYGEGNNWGYKNVGGRPLVGLEEVKKAIVFD